jgi:hypothetical protein
MINGMKRGWIYAAMFGVVGVCALSISMAAVGRAQTDLSNANSSASACAARSTDQPSVGKAPVTDEAGYRRRRARRHTV